MKTDLVIVTASPAKLEFDFEAAETYLKSELEKYDVVVTLDTLPGGKELSKELNKTAGDIDKTRKEKVAEASAPIKDFDTKMKSLTALCKDGRQKILDQIKVFEDKTRKQVELHLHALREQEWDKQGVNEEFYSAEFDDLIILSSFTKSGKLTGKAIAEVRSRVNADKQKQDMVERRLLLLENASYKAGLHAPLTRVHVNSFLLTHDETYNKQLDEIIASEIQRQEVAEEATRKRTIKEAQQDAPAPAVVEEPAAEVVEEPEPKPVKSEPGKVVHTIQATFVVETPDTITADQVAGKLKAVMIEAGISTLTEIKAV